MSPRERIRHLHRRLGFGATPAEVDSDRSLGVEPTRRRLVEYAKTPPGLDVDPREFAWREKEEPDTGTWRVRVWWTARMLATPRPLEERLALFWHDHFAVADDKVENGPMMLGYLLTLRRYAGGRFVDLLKAVAKEPAMMKYLDMNRQVRGVPNENFAREVMELFTLGIGNYSEDDVQAAARALTGWGYNDLWNDLPGDAEQRFRDSIRFERPFVAFYTSPAMHDPALKTVLGRTQAFDGDGLLEMLAEHPQTARYVCGKLWEHFAYDDPEPEVLAALTGVWKRTHGDVTAIVDAITRRPEFFGERAFRNRVKSPIEVTVGVGRACGLGKAVFADRAKDADVWTRIPQRCLDIAGDAAYNAERMGMTLLNPPDVSGWKWGAAWTSAALMAERMKFRGLRLWREGAVGEGAQGAFDALSPARPKDELELAASFAELFDVPLPAARLQILAEALRRGGGLKALERPEDVASLLYHGVPILMASPEMNLC